MISFIFHAALVLVLLYFAARSGLIGHQLQKIAVQIVKIKKPVVKPKPPQPRRVEPPKPAPKIAMAPKIATVKPALAPPVIAPPAAVIPSFGFGDKAVDTSSDPIEIYKGQLQYAFQSKWDRPDNVDDEKYVDEIQVNVSPDGQISNPQWEKSSGNATWDESVRKAIEAVTSIGRAPPTNFPPTVVIKFDVQEENDSLLQ